MNMAGFASLGTLKNYAGSGTIIPTTNVLGGDMSKTMSVTSGLAGVGGGFNWGSTLSGIGQGISGIMTGLTGIGQLYNAYQANELAKKQFAFEKAAYSTNLANQAKMINNSYDAAANISAQLGATTPGDTLASSKAIADYKNKAKDQHVASSIS